MTTISELNGKRILIVDDSNQTLEVTRRHLESAGCLVMTASGVTEGLQYLKDNPVDLVITDCRMPKTSGLDLIRHIRENLPQTRVMMITGYANVENAVEAIKAGAEEYLPKPFTEAELLQAVLRIISRIGRREMIRIHDSANSGRLPGLTSQAPSMQTVLNAVQRAASSNVTVLLSGESGTGKEVIARAIHYGGDRAAAQFVPIHCGAIPETLFESELFGHIRGAFTGATHTRAGFFQTADGGTVFLDEIGEMSPQMQVKLLRVLQDQQVVMVGSDRPRAVDVRIIAATHRDLPELVKQGKFREDLFWRLHVLPIHLPPLRERTEDIMPLVHRFAHHAAESFGRAEITFTSLAMERMTRYNWPGNIRELENTVQRLTVMCDGHQIDVTDLPPALRFTIPESTDEISSMAEMEIQHIRKALNFCDGNKTQAALLLGIDRKTLREKLKEHGE